jgi:hypothetical protein
MVQFYFLSVFFNLVGGASLVLVAMPAKSASMQGLKTFLRDPSVCLVSGILAAVIGAFKLLTVMRGDIPVVGDFLPAITGLAVGLTLLLERFRDPDFAMPAWKEAEEGNTPGQDGAAGGEGAAGPGTEAAGKGRMSKAERFLLDHKMAVGLAGIIAAGVHFLFPMVLFL